MEVNIMAFVDLLGENHSSLIAEIINRIDEKTTKKLEDESSVYQELLNKKNEITDQYPFISKLFDNDELEKENYSKEDMLALQQYIEYSRIIDDYERLEIYKLGLHDCMLMLKQIDIF